MAAYYVARGWTQNEEQRRRSEWVGQGGERMTSAPVDLQEVLMLPVVLHHFTWLFLRLSIITVQALLGPL